MLNKIVSNISAIDKSNSDSRKSYPYTLHIQRAGAHILSIDVINIFVMKKRRKEEDALNIRAEA